MNSIPQLVEFFVAIEDDCKISPIHISLFMAIMQHWNKTGYKNPICVFGRELMKLAKISGVATYHKAIRELDEYGYIDYKPSYNHNKGSLIHIK